MGKTLISKLFVITGLTILSYTAIDQLSKAYRRDKIAKGLKEALKKEMELREEEELQEEARKGLDYLRLHIQKGEDLLEKGIQIGLPTPLIREMNERISLLKALLKAGELELEDTAQ